MTERVVGTKGGENARHIGTPLRVAAATPRTA